MDKRVHASRYSRGYSRYADGCTRVQVRVLGIVIGYVRTYRTVPYRSIVDVRMCHYARSVNIFS